MLGPHPISAAAIVGDLDLADLLRLERHLTENKWRYNRCREAILARRQAAIQCLRRMQQPSVPPAAPAVPLPCQCRGTTGADAGVMVGYGLDGPLLSRRGAEAGGAPTSTPPACLGEATPGHFDPIAEFFGPTDGVVSFAAAWVTPGASKEVKELESSVGVDIRGGVKAGQGLWAEQTVCGLRGKGGNRPWQRGGGREGPSSGQSSSETENGWDSGPRRRGEAAREEDAAHASLEDIAGRDREPKQKASEPPDVCVHRGDLAPRRAGKHRGLNWDGHCSLLAHFQERHGHCFIPWRHHDDNPDNPYSSLGRWVANQKRYYLAKLAGKPTLLADKRERKLQKLWFIFSPSGAGRGEAPAKPAAFQPCAAMGTMMRGKERGDQQD